MNHICSEVELNLQIYYANIKGIFHSKINIFTHPLAIQDVGESKKATQY